MTKHLITLATIVYFLNAQAQPTFEWAHATGGTGADYGSIIVSDDQDNSYSLGRFTGTADLDPGVGVSDYTATAYSTYIRKLDPNGNLLWLYVYESSVFGDIAIDTNGDIIVAGMFEGTVDFDSGPGSYPLTSVNNSFDVYILKISQTGNFIWCRSFGGTSNTHCDGLVIDGQNNLILHGRFSSTVDFDPGPGTMNVSASVSNETYILKLDANADVLWLKTTGTSGSSPNPNYLGVMEIDVSDAGNIHVVGAFKGIYDFDFGSSVNNMTSAGLIDMFLLTLDANGDFVFSKRIGGSDNDVPARVVADHNGNIIIGGFFSGTIDFDPDGGIVNFNSNGNTDCFILKLSSNGSFIWNVVFGNTGIDYLEGLTVDVYNCIYSTGRIQGDVDIDPGPGTYIAAGTPGDWDLYFQKLDTDGNFLFGGSFVGPASEYADEIEVNDFGSIYMSGEMNLTVDFDPGAGTFIVTSNGLSDNHYVKLSQCFASQSTINPVECFSYTSPSGNNTWTVSDTYTDTIPNTAGCDSIITINLTITGPSTGTDTVNACDSYVWIDGNTYTSNNSTATYTLVGAAVNGCDSIVTLNLTINTVNVSTTINNDSLGANTIGALYQWLDCDNNYAQIAGANGQLYVATDNGNYAVEITQNGCVDTSACLTVEGIGFSEIGHSPDWLVYPNPGNGLITIDFGKEKKGVSLLVVAADGRVISEERHDVIQKIETLIKGSPGVYYLYVRDGKEMQILRFVKI